MLHPLSLVPRSAGTLLNRLPMAIFLAVATLGIAACSLFQPDEAALRQYFDERTGANITSLTQPLVFDREQPWLAAGARDYVYFGLIEVSRTGQRDYLLWLGIWSTIDRPGQTPGPVRDVFQTVYLVADGEPMELEITAWSGEDVGMADAAYSTPVDSAASAFYSVTKDQIRRLAQANSILIYTNADAPASTAYMLRQKKSQSIARFASYLSG